MGHEPQRVLPLVRVTRPVRFRRFVAGLLLFAGMAAGSPACSAIPAESPPAQSGQFSGTPSEYTIAMAKCMSERGVPVAAIVTPDGESVVAAENTGPGASESLGEVSELCAAEIGYPPVPSTEAEIRELHDHLKAQYECLQDAGWPADTPPSLQVLQDEVLDRTVTYDPFRQIPADELDAARTDCPRDWTKWW